MLASPNPYDQVPYESHPFRQTHPNRLAAIGALFGMRPAAVNQCRVLELGCASGGNLIPMAVQLPGSHFLGVDLSEVQIAQGREAIAHLGLKNIELRHCSITDVDESFGKFDYVVSHGVFSWVPTAVQEAIFTAASRNLGPQGIAYVSYNTYPGWHMRGLIRAMMRYHATNFATPQLRTRHARGLLDFLANSVPNDGSAYTALLRQEVEVLRHQADYYLFHEHLEEVNEPIFFHEFIARAQQHKLQYLGEANVRNMMLANLPEGVQNALRVMATDQIQLEQYMDFLRNRTFRETLLCHASVRLSRSLDGEQIRRLWLTSQARAEGEALGAAKTAGSDPVSFQSPNGFKLTTSIPVMKAAFVTLGESWPQATSFEDLVSKVSERLQGTPGKLAQEDRSELASRLMHGYLGSDLVELQSAPMSFVREVSEKPVACPLAREQAKHQEWVSNRRHEVIRLNPVQAVLLPLLDGTRDQAMLLAVLREAVEQDRLSVRQGEEECADVEKIEEMLQRALQMSLQQLAVGAVLVA